MTDPTVSLSGAEWLRDGVLARLLELLSGDGEEARVVGGAVRNALLGEPIHEFDIATTLAPVEVMRRANEAGFKAVPTGIEHGTITVVIDSRPFEVTTLREDVETFGRHASVRFGRDWEADAQRRDFTMNALSVGIDGVVHDTVGGLADLKARRVRFIGDPNKRIEEDYLRVLRFFRFHAAYGQGAPDAAGLAACIAHRGGMAYLSRERVRMELMKLLLARRAAAALASMAEAGLLVPVLGGVPDLAGFENMAKAEAAAGVQADAARRLAALAARIPEDAERLWQRLRLSNAEHEQIATMADRWWAIAPGDAKAGRALLYRLGRERFADRVMLAWSRAAADAWRAGQDAAWLELLRLGDSWVVPVFPLKAADFIRRGVRPGPGLGAALHEAGEAWIAADFPADATSLDAIADAASAGIRPM